MVLSSPVDITADGLLFRSAAEVASGEWRYVPLRQPAPSGRFVTREVLPGSRDPIQIACRPPVSAPDAPRRMLRCHNCGHLGLLIVNDNDFALNLIPIRRAFVGRSAGDSGELPVSTAALRLVGVNTNGSDFRGPFLAALEVARQMATTTHLTSLLHWGGQSDPRFGATLMITTMDDFDEQMDALTRVVLRYMTTPRSPWDVEPVHPDDVVQPKTGDAGSTRQTTNDVAVESTAVTKLPTGFGNPGPGSWEPLIGGEYMIDPVRFAPSVFGSLSHGRPWIGVEDRALANPVTADELSFLLCWPVDSDRVLRRVGNAGDAARLMRAVPAADAVVVGQLMDGSPVRPAKRDRTQRLAMLSESGSGKTTLLTDLALAGRT